MISQAVILVGGRGSRLGHMTRECPKPMLEVAGKPFLEHVLENLRAQGVKKVHFCCGYLGRVILDHFGNGSGFGLNLSYTFEDAPADTGGALKLASGALETNFFVFNGDTYFALDLKDFAWFFFDTRAPAALALREVDDISSFGSVILEQQRVIRFNEKGSAGSGLVNGGIYCLSKEALERLGPAPCSLERHLFPDLASAKLLAGKAYDSYFIDIGLPETLEKARCDLQKWAGSRNA